nr:translational initiation factor 2 alpha SU [Cryptomonas sp.]
MDVRSYESLYPQIGNVTIVQVKEIIEMGAYVQLLEYNNAQAMLMLSEISRRRIRSLNRVIKIGKSEVVMIIRAESDKGYIDVSKRQIVESESCLMEKKWNYSKNINSISNHISRCSFVNCEDLKIRWIWLLYRKYGHAIKGIKRCFKKSKETLIGTDIFFKEQRKLSEILKKKFSLAFPHIAIEFEFFLFSKTGINTAKKLIEYQLKKFGEKNIEIRSIVPPLYIVSITCETKKIGLKILMSFLNNILENVLGKNGNLCVKKIISI